jgi:hypothetical protein
VSQERYFWNNDHGCTMSIVVYLHETLIASACNRFTFERASRSDRMSSVARRWLFKNMHAAEECEVCIASTFIIFCLPRGCARSPSWKNKRALNHWRVLRRADPFCPPQTAHTLCHGAVYFSFTFSSTWLTFSCAYQLKFITANFFRKL